MIEYETKLKAWGNSLGIIVPKSKVKEEHLKSEQTVKVIIVPHRSLKVKDIYGKFKKWKRPTKEILDEIDREMDSKF